MAKPTLRFSIVIGAYNAAASIERCLQSLLAQTFASPRYEIIVVDDGSHDNTSALVRRFARVRLVTLAHNQGPAAARNAGLQIARGQITISFDADCQAAPDWLAQLDRAYTDNPAAAGVAGQLINGHHGTLLDEYLNLSGYGNPSRFFKGRGGNPLARLRAFMLNNFMFRHPDSYYEIHHAFGANASFYTELLRAVGGWNPQLRAAEDTDLSERIRRQFPDHILIGAPRAKLIHVHDLTIPGFLIRSVRRGPAVLAYYRYNQLFPPIFPGPLAVAALAILGIAAGATLWLPLIPLVCYPWYALRFALSGNPRQLVFAYLEFLNECAGILGLLYGTALSYWSTRKVVSHG